MRSITVQISGLAGIVVFLNYLWENASLEQAIMAGFGVGIGVYLVLILGEILIRQILAQNLNSESPEDAKVKSESVATDAAAQATADTANA